VGFFILYQWMQIVGEVQECDARKVHSRFAAGYTIN